MGLFKRKAAAESAEDAIDWPPVNALVWIRLPCCDSAIHPSRVENLAGGNLVLAAPSKPHTSLVPAPERPFIIGWKDGPGTAQVSVQFMEDNHDGVPTWTVEALEKPEVIQRRRFVRAPWQQDVVIRLPTQEIEGRMLDISEGGLRALIPKVNEPRNYFHVEFELAERTSVFDVEVAWWGDSSDDTIQVGLQFVGLQRAAADRLRSHVFALQLAGRHREE